MKFRNVKWTDTVYFAEISSPKYKIMKKQSVPCYVRNGGVHNVINLPLGQFTRVRLKLLCKELLSHLDTLETFVAAKATPQNITLLRGLVELLSLDLKPKKNREAASLLTAANEKNLKPTTRGNDNEENEINLVDFAIKFSLLVALFMLSSMLQYFESLNY